MPHDGGGPDPSNVDGTLISETFPADFRWVRRWIHRTIEALGKRGISTDDLGSVEIVLAEALNNVVEHAYPDDTTGNIRLVVRSRTASLLIEITDWGAPMPKGRAPIGNHPMAEFSAEDAMPEGGYGWFIIREIVRDLVYDRRGNENILLFRIKLSDPS